MREDLLETFASIVGPADAPVPLLESALAYAACMQDGDIWPGASAALTELEEDAATACQDLEDEDQIAQRLLDRLGRAGFAGDTEHYEDVRNSLLDRVLERRRGIPITLSVLLIHVAGRCGIDLHGIAFPGHFLVGRRLEEAEPLVLDPFAGRRLDLDEIGSLYARVVGHEVASDSADLRAHLAPAHSRLILTRMLQNLRRHHMHGGSHERAADALELLAILHPELAAIQAQHGAETRRRDLLH